jgi:sulfane dehydrogenase subunit SoxC
MRLDDPLPDFPIADHARAPEPGDRFDRAELALAFRNRGLPLEALRYDTTPVGLHYLLNHFDIPRADPADWTLEIGGQVKRPTAFGMNEILTRPAVSRPITMECAGNGRALMWPRPVSPPWIDSAVGTAVWTGTPLRGLLDEVGLEAEAVELVFTGIDAGIEAGEVQRYRRSLTVAEAGTDDVLLVWAMNGAPLEPQHGAPLRLIVAGWYGMASVKWLARIEAVERPFDGHYMVGTYRYAVREGELGEPATVQRVRALMVPPGIPHFFTRQRFVAAGRIALEGRAWAGRRRVVRVELSADGGARFRDASLEEAGAPCCWQRWTFDWDARSGEHLLVVRATDETGEVQPLEPVWNRAGVGNNVAQRVEVVVR